MFVGVAGAEAVLLLAMQTDDPELTLKCPPPPDVLALPRSKPRRDFFSPGLRFHMNNLAVCQGIVFPTCSPMVWILA